MYSRWKQPYYLRHKMNSHETSPLDSTLNRGITDQFLIELEEKLKSRQSLKQNGNGNNTEYKMGFGREMDGCGQFMKYSMFLSNLVIFIGGLTVLGIGIWTLKDRSFINDLLGTNLFMGAVYILIVTGILIALIAFFGCLGAVKEIKCLLLMYFIIVFIIFIVILVGGILGYVYREKARTTMEQEMRNSIREYNTDRNIKRAWDETQATLHCCGITDYSNWQGTIPESCCMFDKNNEILRCTNNPVRDVNIYSKGCLNVTEQFVKDHAAIIGGAGIGVACIMLLGMIFSCALFKMIE